MINLTIEEFGEVLKGFVAQEVADVSYAKRLYAYGF